MKAKRKGHIQIPNLASLNNPEDIKTESKAGDSKQEEPTEAPSVPESTAPSTQ